MLAQYGVLRDQVFAIGGDVRRNASSENARCWFGEFLDGFFDMMEEGLAGVEDSTKHDGVCILVS